MCGLKIKQPRRKAQAAWGVANDSVLHTCGHGGKSGRQHVDLRATKRVECCQHGERAQHLRRPKQQEMAGRRGASVWRDACRQVRRDLRGPSGDSSDEEDSNPNEAPRAPHRSDPSDDDEPPAARTATVVDPGSEQDPPPAPTAGPVHVDLTAPQPRPRMAPPPAAAA